MTWYNWAVIILLSLDTLVLVIGLIFLWLIIEALGSENEEIRRL